MPPPDETLQLRVDVDSADDEATADDTARLRRQLLQLDVLDVARPPSGTEAGARAGAGVELGALLVTLAPPLLTTVLGTIQSWAARRRTSTITVTLGDKSLTISGGATPDERARLVDAFLAHGTGDR